MGVIGVLLLVLNLLGGFVSGIWLALIGEWWALGLGLIALLVSNFLIAILLMPRLLFVVPAAALHERGKRWFALVLASLSSLYTVALMTIWGIGILFVFASRATAQSVIPLLIWSYGVASGPWSFLASKDEQAGGNEYSAISVFFFQVGYVIAIVLLFVLGIPALSVLALAATMAVGWLLQLVFFGAQMRGEALMRVEGKSAATREQHIEEPARAEPVTTRVSDLSRLVSIDWDSSKSDVQQLLGDLDRLPDHPSQNAIGFVGDLAGLPAVIVLYFTRVRGREALGRIGVTFFDPSMGERRPSDEETLRQHNRIKSELVAQLGLPKRVSQFDKNDPPEFRQSEVTSWLVGEAVVDLMLALLRDGIPQTRPPIGLVIASTERDPTAQLAARSLRDYQAKQQPTPPIVARGVPPTPANASRRRWTMLLLLMGGFVLGVIAVTAVVLFRSTPGESNQLSRETAIDNRPSIRFPPTGTRPNQRDGSTLSDEVTGVVSKFVEDYQAVADSLSELYEISEQYIPSAWLTPEYFANGSAHPEVEAYLRSFQFYMEELEWMTQDSRFKVLENNVKLTASLNGNDPDELWRHVREGILEAQVDTRETMAAMDRMFDKGLMLHHYLVEADERIYWDPVAGTIEYEDTTTQVATERLAQEYERASREVNELMRRDAARFEAMLKD